MLKIEGIIASPGFSIGKAVIYRHDIITAPHVLCCDDNDKKNNIAIFENACHMVVQEIEHLISLSTNKEESDILFTHRLMVEDPEFTASVINEIEKNGRCAPWAVEVVSETQKILLANIDSELFKERIADLQNISDSILKILLKADEKEIPNIGKNSIIVADFLTPSEIVKMDKTNLKGFALISGGKTSHVAVLAHSLNIPCLFGLNDLLTFTKDDDQLILDCCSGALIINPDSDVIKRAQSALELKLREDEELEEDSALPAITIDGKEIKLELNISGSENLEALYNTGAEGIGLFRTEFLLMNNDKQKEVDVYSSVAEKSVGKGDVIIRTYDVGGDKFVEELSVKEENPILGWRAVRFTLANKELFKTQLEAILKASVYKNIKIMFPMISGVEELDECLALLEEVKSELREQAVLFDEDIKVGIMIEVPSAALCSKTLAEKVDFFSVGTNDLIQYTLAVDRGNEKIAYLYNPLHPGVLKLLAMVAENANLQHIECGMCGEMASVDLYTPLLIGLGFTSLSMNSQSIAKVRHVIRNISYKEAKDVAMKALNMASSVEIETLLKEFLNGKIRNSK